MDYPTRDVQSQTDNATFQGSSRASSPDGYYTRSSPCVLTTGNSTAGQLFNIKNGPVHATQTMHHPGDRSQTTDRKETHRTSGLYGSTKSSRTSRDPPNTIVRYTSTLPTTHTAYRIRQPWEYLAAHVVRLSERTFFNGRGFSPCIERGPRVRRRWLHPSGSSDDSC